MYKGRSLLLAWKRGIRRGKKLYIIGICDDEKNVCIELEKDLIKIAKKINIMVEVRIWHSGEEVCEFLDKGTPINILFLDIELMKISGIDVGVYIRDSKD